MSRKDGGRPGKAGNAAGRHITPDEAELWHRLAQSLDKVKTKPRVAARGAEAPAPAPPKAAAQQPAATPRRRAASPPPPAAPAPAPMPVPAQFDRRTLRQVAAGKVPIDAVLDLHGLTQDAAHRRLHAFLLSSQADGLRMLLVITGKGGGRHEASETGAGPRGVLRRSVPQWLEEPDLRGIVLGYSAAGVRHGGEGALYIRLRKAREG